MLRFLFGFHPTRPHGKGRFRLSPVPASCSCLRFMVASSWLHTGLAPAAIHPCQAHPVALRAPSDPADVILSINVLIYDPPPPSTLISRSGLSQGCWHRGLLLFRCVLSTDFGTSMPSMSAEESIPSLDGGSTAQDAVTDRDAGNDLVETGSAPPASTSPCQHQITEI